jgi:16S rRNA (adenine1518-N6/adenine1519-N6)-dimethyltransferase
MSGDDVARIRGESAVEAEPVSAPEAAVQTRLAAESVFEAEPASISEAGSDPGKVVARLRQSGFRFKKKWGQNLLLDTYYLGRIADQAQIRPGETVVEIGAGTGALTQALARRGARVLAIEIDPALLPLLRDGIRGFDQVRAIPGDALKMNLDQLAASAGLPAPPTPYKIVANLPYSISTPALTHIMTRARHWGTAVLTLQAEVARKLTAAPGTAGYGVLTLTTLIFGGAQILFNVPARAFTPVPAVESAVVRLTRRPRPLEADTARLNALIRAAFGKRRKTLANALQGLSLPESYGNWPDALAAAGIDPRRRGETLSLDEYVTLARL